MALLVWVYGLVRVGGPGGGGGGRGEGGMDVLLFWGLGGLID